MKIGVGPTVLALRQATGFDVWFFGEQDMVVWK
jgi:hypothetical protein